MAETIRPHIYRVSEINNYLSEMIAEEDFLHELAIVGEISGYTAHRSGHIYFTLKDGGCAIKVVMFRRYAESLQWHPANGDEVIVLGGIQFYERDGACQLYCQRIFPSGNGIEARRLEELKQYLASQGLFDQERKKNIPGFVRSIGVITSPTGAAWHDIQRVGYARWPGVRLSLYPALVQGDQAPESIAQAIAKADDAGHDVLIAGRGGGAHEDLSAFNTELVVMAIAAANTPVISAVGHEIDITLADLAADARAATPSHAAEMAVFDAAELQADLHNLSQRLTALARQKIALSKGGLSGLATRRVFAQPDEMLRKKEQVLADLDEKMNRHTGVYLENKESLLMTNAQALNLMNPLSVLDRGYAIVRKDGKVIKDSLALSPDDRIDVSLAKGDLSCLVQEIKGGNYGK